MYQKDVCFYSISIFPGSLHGFWEGVRASTGQGARPHTLVPQQRKAHGEAGVISCTGRRAKGQGGEGKQNPKATKQKTPQA